jgi:adenine-specific DNA-methyltransferase
MAAGWPFGDVCFPYVPTHGMVHGRRARGTVTMISTFIRAESDLAGLAVALGADDLGRLSEAEKRLSRNVLIPSKSIVSLCRDAIRQGLDPLGDSFCALRNPADRRLAGATYTPSKIITAMTSWAASREPIRVVDPGAGSGRFIVAAGRLIRDAQLIAVEIDPLAALICRAHIVTAGLAHRSQVIVADYRNLDLPTVAGVTAFLGNPPYVRHHAIDARWKTWLVNEARLFGLDASQLAGLHVYFLLATARMARTDDIGSFVTAAEWLDVNYGSLVRKLFLGSLGGESLHVVNPTVLPFNDAATTAVISCFKVGAQPSSICLRRVESLDHLAPLNGGRPVRRDRLETAMRWTPLMNPVREVPDGYVELGELCRVHRGQVTGFNKVWIAGPHSEGLPVSLLFPSITKARELFSAGSILSDPHGLRRVIDLPISLDTLPKGARGAVDRFLCKARSMGAHKGFIAQHRKAWWSVRLREPAPILATYMARRPPAFVRNLANARHINIAHGIYPRESMTPRVLDALARYLSNSTSLCDGRTYAGGLTKFEPREMERIMVPGPDLLASLVV